MNRQAAIKGGFSSCLLFFPAEDNQPNQKVQAVADDTGKQKNADTSDEWF